MSLTCAFVGNSDNWQGTAFVLANVHLLGVSTLTPTQTVGVEGAGGGPGHTVPVATHDHPDFRDLMCDAPSHFQMLATGSPLWESPLIL